MKKLILILALFSLLSCEKEKPFQEYELIVRISNTLPPGVNAQSPKCYTYEYLNRDVLMHGQGDYVGEGFKMHWNSNMQLYVKAESEHWVQIKIWRDGIDNDGDHPWKYAKGYQVAIIN